ncbi:bifunctional 4-hydroxy-2-oxoglutarate aldolase/2-dehydro-3-deoxy-phosphogluconate aldolase [Owenweeksia hongkongensis]|uniref:bifunctional 4-hydroxy-2-oxoglutarate aldolase/2-dehydro-3-deoxy-phosphogluconate aldolase n=1 Tax=Owenweeksia hongkongensis TaxID=253245 RepID=UPI003A8F5B6F
MKKEDVIAKMAETKIVPLFYNADAEVAKKLVDACFAGGARVIEFTNRGEKAVEVFENLLAYCNSKYPELALGIGSISSVAQAKQFIEIGAHFLVSPFINEDLAKTASANDIFWTGGCGTITEMQTAYSWGVPLLKLFPGNIFGPAMIKGAKAPCPWLQIMPTGGVEPTEDNLNSWFSAGAMCVGMGSKLFAKKENGEFDYDAIQEKVSISVNIASHY